MIELDIIESAKKSNRAAQTKLYEMHKTTWYMICLRYTKNKHDADDCLQSAIVSILSNLDKFDASKGSFKGWSNKIVVNENIRFLGKRSAFVYEVNDIAQDTENNQFNERDYPISPKNLTKMIQNLPLGYSTVFNLYVMEGYRHNEIAEILNISTGTSKSQLSKAKKMLKYQLEEMLKKAC